MTAAMTMPWASAAPTRPQDRRSRPRSRRAQLPTVARAHTPLFAVQCAICEKLGPVFATRERAYAPPKNSGWRYLTVAGIGGWWCPEDQAKRLAMLPPATRGECVDGERPCTSYLCRWNLHFDRSRKAPPGFQVLKSCALDVADEGDHTLRDLGVILGMTREGIREIELSAKAKLIAIPGIAFDFQDDEEDPYG